MKNFNKLPNRCSVNLLFAIVLFDKGLTLNPNQCKTTKIINNRSLNCKLTVSFVTVNYAVKLTANKARRTQSS